MTEFRRVLFRSANLLSLGGPAGAACTPTTSSACLLDNALSTGTKSGYTFIANSVAGGPPTVSYIAAATPVTLNQTGTRSFCSFEDAVVRYQPTGAAVTSVATCKTLSPLN